MIKFNKKVAICLVAVSTLVASFGSINALAYSAAYNNANSKVNQLETSLEKNYLGSKNLPTFRIYLKEAKDLTLKVTSASEKAILQDRINQYEAIIITTEHIVNMEASMEKNYRGMKNVPAFQAYIDKVNASLANVKNKIIHQKISERSYAGFNVVRDIKVANSDNYLKASSLLDEAVDLLNSSNIENAKSKANEALSYVWKCDTSLIKDAIAAELKDISNM